MNNIRDLRSMGDAIGAIASVCFNQDHDLY